MGIKGLLNMLEEISEKKNVREYAGLKVGVDAFCW
jgi:hypothetical protein